MAKKGSNNTILVVALIFAVLVALVAIGLKMKSVSELSQLKIQAAANKQKVESYKTQKGELLEERDKAWKIITGTLDEKPQAYSGYKTGTLKAARTELEAILVGQWVTSEDSSQVRDKNVLEVWEELRKIKETVQDYSGLYELNADLLKRVKLLIHLIPRLRIKRKQKIEELEDALSHFDEDRGKLNARINQESQLLQEVNEQMLAEARDFDRKKRKHQDELEKMRQAQVDRDRLNDLKIVQLRSKIQNLEQDIRELVKEVKKTLDVIGKDGEVVFADPTIGFAWINLGKEHKVMPGMIFDVYRKAKGGRTHLKGKIIVKSIEANMAKATIVEKAVMHDPLTGEELTLPRATDPIVKGDLIRSPLFDKEETQTFVLLGKKASNNKFGKAELALKIEAAGGKVQKTVGVATKFVVQLDNAEEDFPDQIEKAAQFGVIFLTEKDLLNYLTR